MYTVSFFDEKVYTNFGFELSREFGFGKKWSTNLAGSFHYGEHKNTLDQNVTVKDFFWGIQPDIRRYFSKRYDGGYIGLGSDIKFLIAKNFFPPTPTDPGTLGNIEFNIGLTFGYMSPINKENLNFKIEKDLYINPYFYFGFDPNDNSEYEINFRIGINVGF